MGDPSNKPASKKLPNGKGKVEPEYSMRRPRRFEKGDFCPECQRSAVNGDNRGMVFCNEQGCGFSEHISGTTTTDYAQINYKLMAIMNRGR